MAVVDTIAAVERTRTVAERTLAARLERAELERTRAEEASAQRAEAERTRNERIDEQVADERLRDARAAASARLESVRASDDQTSFADHLAELSRVQGLRLYQLQADQREAVPLYDPLARFIEQSVNPLAIA